MLAPGHCPGSPMLQGTACSLGPQATGDKLTLTRRSGEPFLLLFSPLAESAPGHQAGAQERDFINLYCPRMAFLYISSSKPLQPPKLLRDHRHPRALTSCSLYHAQAQGSKQGRLPALKELHCHLDVINTEKTRAQESKQQRSAHECSR